MPEFYLYYQFDSLETGGEGSLVSAKNIGWSSRKVALRRFSDYRIESTSKILISTIYFWNEFLLPQAVQKFLNLSYNRAMKL